MWTGDQNSNFERYDGLPANVPAVLSAGISGHPIPATDIAGYNCFVNRSADRELFMRWTELGALLPVMRLHRGNDEVCDHWSFDRDRETLDHFKKYAVLHTALFPYFYTLAYEARDRGWPVIRHLMLHFPDDPATWRLDYEFLVGDRVLAAPALERDAREVEVYFPEGDWVHWWSGTTYAGPGRVTVPAELGEAPIFVRSGKILPVFDGRIDTLVVEDREDLAGFDDANASLKIIFYGSGRDEYTLWDGTRITCARSGGEAGTCEISGAPRERSYRYEFDWAGR
jgi:alpha-glucosidase (family GH31 glycosyl hydrolase)